MKVLRAGLMALVATALLVVAAPLARADVVSDPQPHAELARAPGWVSMAFDFQLDPSTAKMLVLNSAGENVTVGSLIVEWKQVTSQLRDELPEDTYTVNYRVSRTNGEPMGGSYQFAIGKGTWTPSGTSSWKGSDKEPGVMKNPDPNSTATAPTAVPSPSETPTDEPETPTPTPTPTATATPAPGPTGSDGSGAWVWAIGGVTAVAAAGAAGLWWWRRRNQED